MARRLAGYGSAQQPNWRDVHGLCDPPGGGARRELTVTVLRWTARSSDPHAGPGCSAMAGRSPTMNGSGPGTRASPARDVAAARALRCQRVVAPRPGPEPQVKQRRLPGHSEDRGVAVPAHAGPAVQGETVTTKQAPRYTTLVGVSAFFAVKLLMSIGLLLFSG